jgi:hypothetical protein
MPAGIMAIIWLILADIALNEEIEQLLNQAQVHMHSSIHSLVGWYTVEHPLPPMFTILGNVLEVALFARVSDWGDLFWVW